MKLRNYALILSVLTVIEITILALSTHGNPITQITISKIGSLEGNYTFFLLATSILIIMFALFLHKLYESIHRDPKIDLYIMPVLSVIGLLFKSGPDFNFSKIIHTILFVISAILVVRIMWDLNEVLQKKPKRIITAPRVAFFGTLLTFIFVGPSLIAEAIYLGAVLSWINIASAAV